VNSSHVKLDRFHFDKFSRNGRVNHKANTLSGRPTFPSRVGAMTAAGRLNLLRMKQWLEIGAMQLYNINLEVIRIGKWQLISYCKKSKSALRKRICSMRIVLQITDNSVPAEESIKSMRLRTFVGSEKQRLSKKSINGKNNETRT
jgi:hypothetical protein